MFCKLFEKLSVFARGIPHRRLQQGVDKVGHHLVVAAHVAVEGQLVAGAVKVVGGILDFVVGVTIDVVGEETHALHEGEQRHSIG